MIELSFTSWGRFRADHDKAVVRRWLNQTGTAAKTTFSAGQAASGRKSSPGQYPANQSGALGASFNAEVTDTSLVVGTDVFYAAFLRNGTRKMARRSMSDTALRTALDKTKDDLRGWVKWRR